MGKEDNLVKFKKGQSGNLNGRPKKIENILKGYFFEEHNLKLNKTDKQQT